MFVLSDTCHGLCDNAYFYFFKFILDGEVDVILKNKEPVVLKQGDFFGEIALLKDVKRTATVKSNGRCEMLELTTYDLKRLIQSRPDIIESIEKVAKVRFDFL